MPGGLTGTEQHDAEEDGSSSEEATTKSSSAPGRSQRVGGYRLTPKVHFAMPSTPSGSAAPPVAATGRRGAAAGSAAAAAVPSPPLMTGAPPAYYGAAGRPGPSFSVICFDAREQQHCRARRAAMAADDARSAPAAVDGEPRDDADAPEAGRGSRIFLAQGSSREDEGVASKSKAFRGVHKMRRRFEREPMKVMQAYLDRMQEQLSVTHASQAWSCRRKMRGLWRCHLIMSEALQRLIEGRRAHAPRISA